MKRFWLGLGILAAFLAAGFFVKEALEVRCRQTGALVQQAAEAAEKDNFAGARKALAQARQQWQRSGLLASAFCDHRSLEQAEMLLSELEVYAQREDSEGFLVCGSRLLQLLEAMAATQRLDLSNLL